MTINTLLLLSFLPLQHAGAAFALFQTWPRKNGTGPLQGQKALRQACRRRPARRQAFHRPRHEIQRQVLLIVSDGFPEAELLLFSVHCKVHFYGGVKVSTGGARSGQRVAAGELLYNSSKQLTDNNNYQLLAA